MQQINKQLVRPNPFRRRLCVGPAVWMKRTRIDIGVQNPVPLFVCSLRSPDAKYSTEAMLILNSKLRFMLILNLGRAPSSDVLAFEGTPLIVPHYLHRRPGHP